MKNYNAQRPHIDRLKSAARAALLILKIIHRKVFPLRKIRLPFFGSVEQRQSSRTAMRYDYRSER